MRQVAPEKILLVNPNRMQPPIAPIGLDLLAQALQDAGFAPELLDLCRVEDVGEAITALDPEQYLFAALSVRNTDDSFFPGQNRWLPAHREVVRLLQTRGVKVVCGGVGFSIMPRLAANYLECDLAIAGDGETALPMLATALSAGETPRAVPGLVGTNPPAIHDISRDGVLRRDFIDNTRYLREGGQIGFETKRGCAYRCAACVEPLAKGRRIRMREPVRVAAELAGLAARGIDTFHTCDSEFNVPTRHALEVCRAIQDAGLAGRIRWYAYCTPFRFGEELAKAMRKAGCVGVNFSADHGDPAMLRRLQTPHGREDIERAVKACKTAGLRVMCDLLLGSPGETRVSLETTFALMERLNPTRVGVSMGIRLYPGCAVTEEVQPEAAAPGIHADAFDPSLLQPVYYREPGLGEDIEDWITERIGANERFFWAGSSHNYDGNRMLEEAIGEGARGAYWDILARRASAR